MTADSLGAREADRILPVVPMFHANAWGLAHAGVAAGADLVMPGPDLSGTAIADLDRRREGHRRGRRADDLDERAARAEGPRHVAACGSSRAAGRPCRRRCREAYREQLGLPILQAWGMTETSPVASVCTLAATRSCCRRRAGRPARRASVGSRSASSAASSSPAARRRCRGTASRAASCSARDRGSRPTYYNDPRSRRQLHRRRLAAHRRRRAMDERGRIRLVDRTKDLIKSRRRVDLVGRAGERADGPPEDQGGRRHRRARTRSGASGRWPASCSSPARS